MPTVFARTRMSCRKPRPSRPPRVAGTAIGVASFGSFSGPFQKRDSRPGRGAKPRRPRRRHDRESRDAEREPCQPRWHSKHGAQRNRSKGATRSPVAITNHRGHWIPAFAGMTIKGKVVAGTPSPPCQQSWHSKHGAQRNRSKGATRSPLAITNHRGHWIPAFAGMTIKSEEQSTARSATDLMRLQQLMPHQPINRPRPALQRFLDIPCQPLPFTCGMRTERQR
jgi:hypothetical protein